MDRISKHFEWDVVKAAANIGKHGVDFRTAEAVFDDPQRVIAEDEAHSGTEQRYFCFGRVGERVLTVRFNWRGTRIRIIGAGFWREGQQLYEKANGIHKSSDQGEGD